MRGLLGKATDDFCEDGRLVEKTTYGESLGQWKGLLRLPPHLRSLILHLHVGSLSVTLRHTEPRLAVDGCGRVILSSRNALCSPPHLA